MTLPPLRHIARALILLVLTVGLVAGRARQPGRRGQLPEVRPEWQQGPGGTEQADRGGLPQGGAERRRFGSQTKAAIKRVQRKYDLLRLRQAQRHDDGAIDKAVQAATGPRTWYHKETIGRSAGDRAIVAYRAGEPGKPVVMVVATMHGEENFGQYVARGLLEGRKITGVDLWVVPVLNPDGLAKDRRWLSGHVDLNRNFPTSWVRRANSGPKAASAKETRVIMKFLDRVDPEYLVSWHQPLNAVDSDGVKDKGLMNRLADGLDLPKKPLTCGGTCHGTMTQWFNANHDGAAITVEYSSVARSMTRMKGRDADAVLAAIGGRRATTAP